MITLEDFITGPLEENTEAIDVARARWTRKATIESMTQSNAGAEQSRDYKLARAPLLFEYQKEVVDAVVAQWDSGQSKVMASLPTGGGKTRVGLWLVRESLLQGQATNALWLAPTTELIDQAVSALEESWFDLGSIPGVRVKVHNVEAVSGPTSRLAGTISLCTAKLATKQLRNVSAYMPDLIVFDEAHQAAAKTYSRLIERVGSRRGVRTLGLTATPGRANSAETEELSRLFDRNLIVPQSLGQDPVASLVSAGVLATVYRLSINLPAAWDTVRVGSDSDSSMSVDELSLNGPRFWAVVSKACEIAQDRRCLIFGASIAHCKALAAAIVAKGLKADLVSYDQPKEERKKKIDAFRIGAIDVLLNKSILIAGFDDPSLQDVILASPIRSSIQWEQIIGRVSRGPAVGGTRQAKVWELDDHGSLHNRVMAAQRFAGESWD